jgi:Skp family chaperone for outer membrane proteins
MHYLILFLLIFVCHFCYGHSNNSLPLNIAVVDIQKIQAPYKEKIEKSLNQYGEKLRAEFSVIEKELRNEKEEIEKEKQRLSNKENSHPEVEELQKRIQIFEQKVRETLKKEEEHRKELQKHLSNLEIAFSDTLSQVLKDVSLIHKMDLLLPKGAVLFHGDALDFTGMIEKKLQEKSNKIFSLLPKVNDG